jgi:hypothetical protein
VVGSFSEIEAGDLSSGPAMGGTRCSGAGQR